MITDTVTTNRQRLYDALKDRVSNLGTWDEFNERLNDESNRQRLYDALKGRVSNLGTGDEFNNEVYKAPQPLSKSAMSAAQNIKSTVAAKNTSTKGGYVPTPAEQFDASRSMAHTRRGLQEMFDKTKRRFEGYTSKGRERAKLARIKAKAVGAPDKVLGLSAPVSSQAAGNNTGVKNDFLPVRGPQPYDVVKENGVWKTIWSFEDGTLTSSLAVADNEAYLARQGRLRREFVNRMRNNGLNPAKQEDVQRQAQLDYEAPLREAVLARWRQAQKEEKEIEQRYKKEAEKYESSARAAYESSSMGSDGIPHIPLHGGAKVNMDYARRRHEAYDFEKMANDVVASLSPSFKNQALESYKQYFTQHKGELKGRTVTKAAEDALKGWAYSTVHEHAVNNVMPGSGAEFVLRKIGDQPLMSPFQSMQYAGAAMANSYGLESADMDAMSRYGSEHGVLDIVGTVGNMAADPLTWASGGVGSVVGKGAVKLGTKLAIKSATQRVVRNKIGGAVVKSLPKVAGGVAGGAANFATFEMSHDIVNQLRMGGVVNPETGRAEGFSWGHVGNAGVHGLCMGSVTGATGVFIGNAFDKATKAVNNAYGKVAVRTGELAAGTVAEGTIFAAPDLYSVYTMPDKEFDEMYSRMYGYDHLLKGNLTKEEADQLKQKRADARNKAAWDVWDENIAMMIGFKGQHLVKSAPGVIKSLRPYKAGPDGRLTPEERVHNLSSFKERLAKRLDASPSDIDMTRADHEELWDNGYGSLADLFKKKGKHADHATDKRTADSEKKADVDFMRAESDEIVDADNEFDGYADLEKLINDDRVSEAVRAKAYFLFTGRCLPMSTVMGCRVHETDDGSFVVESVNAHGGVVTSRKFKDLKKRMPSVTVLCVR